MQTQKVWEIDDLETYSPVGKQSCVVVTVEIWADLLQRTNMNQDQ